MATSRWSEELLSRARNEADPYADEFAHKVMAGDDRVRRYNHLLELADALLASPSLVLNPKSALRRHLEEFSPEALAYFHPEEVPDWVNEEKLRIAQKLWKDNSIAAVGVLYAYSLPCAYLYKDGVPTLYGTGKLAERRYIFQRIYETGLFADAVMDEDGIEIMEDYVPEPEGDKTASRRREPKRYMWGRGFLAARKVRFLHASIRCMLTKWVGQSGSGTDDDGRHSARGWEGQGDKPPITQKELALVLLTFGYLIPQGLERWGAHISREKKEAFLHLWRLIGHIMGIKDDYMTDDWDEAAELMAAILEVEAAPSSNGETLTVALMEFLQEYMPHLTLGLKNRISAHLIISQLGRMNPDYPPMIIPGAIYKDTRRLIPRVLFGISMLWVRLYYGVRERFGRIPLLGETLLGTLHEASEELIESWRGEFRRRPFDVSREIEWQPGGQNPKLVGWRRSIFNHIASAIVLLFLATAGLVAAIVLAFAPLENIDALLKWLVGGSVVSGVLAWTVMAWRLPRVFARRPKPELT